MRWLLGLLDPDRNWRSFSTIQHFVSGPGYMLLYHNTIWHFPLWTAVTLTLWSAALYEIAQTDVAYNIKDAGGQRYAGRPGYGFGLMDIAATMLGVGLFLLVGWMVTL